MPTEFRLPELGENIEKGDLVRMLVSVGDSIAKEQSVLELETDKATVEVPSSVSGIVKAIHVKEGDQIKVGELILTVEDGAAAKGQPKHEPKTELRTAQAVTPRPKEVQAEPRPSAAISPEIANRDSGAPAEAVFARQEVAPRAAPGEVVEFSSAARTAVEPGAPVEIAPAAPSVRRAARELGVDINQIPGTGPSGRISAEDVHAYVRGITASAGIPGAARVPASALPDFSRWGEVERQPMRGVRRKTAEHLSYAWSTVPHVTQFDKADITHLEELRKQFGKRAEAAGGKLTVTAIALKVTASALRVFPQFGASVDAAHEEIVYKHYCHIGVAVDTDRGLLVPVIRDVDKKNILELSVELSRLAEKARDRKLTPEEMEGGVFTITNLGGIGGTYFSPIVNSPEVAILGLSRASLEPLFRNGAFEPRLMLPLSLSYDHRLIDGADAARFLRWLAEALEQPFLLALQG